MNCLMISRKNILFKSILEDSRHRARRETRSAFTKCKLYLIRVIINLIVFSMLGGAGYLIYFATMKSTEVRLDTKLIIRTMKINYFKKYLLIHIHFIQSMNRMSVLLKYCVIQIIATTSQTHVQFCPGNAAWNFDSPTKNISLKFERSHLGKYNYL